MLGAVAQFVDRMGATEEGSIDDGEGCWLYEAGIILQCLERIEMTLECDRSRVRGTRFLAQG